ncbi:MAG: CCA tRNA nucleotidyltransferase [Candidatus Hodarchaeales archaeon]|jgi:tRNA nucleotidyltransferase/poly(A) polymerase
MELTANQFPTEVLEICRIFSSSGFKAFVVGGSIRDLLRGETRPHDWDIATDASPSEVMDLFSQFRVIPTGIQHGTVTLLFKNLSIEITTFRVEGEYKDGRRPSEVQFVADIEEDLARRDLTINAIAYDPISEKFTDPYDGRSDLNNHILRLVGDPDARLGEDGLRLIRIFRFVSQLGYSVEKSSLAAVPRHLDVFDQVAKERIEAEFQKLMSGHHWQEAVHFLVSTDLLKHIIPEYEHESLHTPLPSLNLTRLDITLQIINDLSSESSVNLRYSALFHQLSILTDDTSILLPDLDKNLLSRILKKLKFPNKRIEDIIHLLAIHKIPLPYSLEEDDDEYKNYSTRRLLYNIQPKFLEDYLIFHQAKGRILGVPTSPNEALVHDVRLRSIYQRPIYLKDLKVDGNEVVTHLNIDKTKTAQRELIGICLELLREQVEVDPLNNSKKGLYDILDQIMKVISLCTSFKIPKISIISTDHVRKLYRKNFPDYSSWESAHTYQLAIWVVSCILRRNKSTMVIFDGTNFNSPSHPFHRQKLYKNFKYFNPIFLHTFASKDDVKLNINARNLEERSLSKSDADIIIYNRYETLLDSYSNSLQIPRGSQIIELSTRSNNYEQMLNDIASMMTKNNHRLVIMSGNVLTGKTFTAKKIREILGGSTTTK